MEEGKDMTETYHETPLIDSDDIDSGDIDSDDDLDIDCDDLVETVPYPGVSVIIPATRAEAAALTLRGLSLQCYGGRLEVIVVGPPAAQLAHHWPIIAVHPEAIYPPGKARNLGAAEATSKILLFLDDDMLVTVDWIEQNVRALQQEGVGAVGARMPGKAQTFYARCADFTNYGHYQHTRAREELLGAGSLGIWRALFVELGGFDEELRSGEDVELCRRIQRRGYRTLYQPEIVAVHDHHYDTLSKLLRYNYSHGFQSGLATKLGERGIRAYIVNGIIQLPFLFLPLLPLFALLGMIRIVDLNRRDSHRVLLYSPFIFLGKLAYQSGVFVSLMKEKKRRGRGTTDNPAEARASTKNVWYRLQAYLRKRRFRFVQRLLVELPPAYELLDVGGTQEFWRQLNFQPEDGTILLYNLNSQNKSTITGITDQMGDARDMREFPDQHFDLVFSNSVIEHVGSYQQQEQMAREVRRVGKRYCVQTPNRYFPIEPHVLWPCFQFLPRHWQIFILTSTRSLWGWRITSKEEAERYVDGIRLLSEKELRVLFPDARIYREKFLGLTKSFLVYSGW
jgi:glycosyltransferase involved in cell wall biosynthesis